MTIGFALCGSFCTFDKVFPVMELLNRDYQLLPIVSDAVLRTDTRFGTAEEHLQTIRELTGSEPVHTIAQAEPIGPKKLLDLLIIAPCTGNTLAKLAHGIADGPVTLAAKSHLRNDRPILLAVSTNDALAAAAGNIGRLMARRNIYFVPFTQDDAAGKPTSCVADFSLIPKALEAALERRQLQPLLI